MFRGYVSLGSPCLTAYSGSESSAFSLARVAAVHFSRTTQLPPAPRTRPSVRPYMTNKTTYTHDVCMYNTSNMKRREGTRASGGLSWSAHLHRLPTARLKPFSETCFKRVRLRAHHQRYTAAHSEQAIRTRMGHYSYE